MGRKRLQMKKQAKGYQRKVMKKRAPKVFEDAKEALFLRGGKSSAVITSVLRDLTRMKKPYSKMLARRNDLLPMEDGGEASVEFLCEKNDASLFAIGMHSKKRPHNLVLGRTFDGRVLDMIEVGVEDFVSIDDAVKARHGGGATFRVGSRPLLVFAGDQWEHGGETMLRLRNLLLDFFQGQDTDRMLLGALDHVIVATAVGKDEHAGVPSDPNAATRSDDGRGQRIKLRHYHMSLSKGAQTLASAAPKAALSPIGFSMDMLVRRSRIAPRDLWREAVRVPREAKARKQKNVTRDEMGNKLGRVHMEKQDLDRMPMKKMKALRKPKKGEDPAEET